MTPRDDPSSWSRPLFAYNFFEPPVIIGFEAYFYLMGGIVTIGLRYPLLEP